MKTNSSQTNGKQNEGGKPANSKHSPKKPSNGSWKKQAPRGTQGRKDSKDKRVNYDNERESKFTADAKKLGCNDISWYANNAELMKAAGSLPFSSVLGNSVFQYAVPFGNGNAYIHAKHSRNNAVQMVSQYWQFAKWNLSVCCQSKC